MTFVRALFSTLFMLGASAGLMAQQPFQYLGPNECLNCHDHAAEKEWYEKKEIPEVQRIFPDKSANAGHINSLNQLETAKSDEFAKAIGLKDKYDLNGACVTCHATVYRGDANAGVSCESCHGPGSGYLKPHQTKDSYDLSVAQYGMTKLIGNMQGWTQQCTNCHVMNDDRLIKAGHPAGDDFDLGKRFLPVSLHFKKKYLGHRRHGGWEKRTGRDHSAPPWFDDSCGGDARGASSCSGARSGTRNSRHARGASRASSDCATRDTRSSNRRSTDYGPC